MIEKMAKPWLTYQSMTKPSNGLLLSSSSTPAMFKLSLIKNHTTFDNIISYLYSLCTDKTGNSTVDHIDDNRWQNQDNRVNYVCKLHIF